MSNSFMSVLTKTADKQTTLPKIYISYRSGDYTDWAQSIRDWFALRLGPVNVIADLEIPPFAASVEYYLRQRIRECDVFILVIGPNWRRLLTENLQRSEDVTRLEVRIALDEGLVIRPIYTLGAPTLRESELPHDLRLIARFPSSVLTDNFEASMEVLIQETTAVAQDIVAMSQAEVDKRYAAFEEAYLNNHLVDALKLLQEIQEYGQLSGAFRLQVQQRIRQLKRRIQFQVGKPIYERIGHLIHQNPVHGYYVLQQFMAEYPEVGDPNNLLTALRPRLQDIEKDQLLLENPDTPAEQRLAIGDSWATLSDPRPGVGVITEHIPDIAWVKIPDGEFTFHFDQRIELPTYYISRYPITYTQFQAFIDDGGLENPAWWDDLAPQEFPPEPRWSIGNYPRLRVSWYDAVAFTRWLSDKLGLIVRLPTEEEWEKAARGPNSTIYPWGENYLAGYSNINEVISGVSETNLRQPTAVGVFPHAASHYGVEDMIGNVWEWCLNVFDDPSITTIGGEDTRTMRGGAWSSDRLFAHTFRRRGEAPVTRLNDVGFRVVCEALPLEWDNLN